MNESFDLLDIRIGTVQSTHPQLTVDFGSQGVLQFPTQQTFSLIDRGMQILRVMNIETNSDTGILGFRVDENFIPLTVERQCPDGYRLA